MDQQYPRMPLERWRMIGLEKGIVRVVPHHPTWQDVFEQERRVLQEYIGGHVLDIQHVGSTAVPGLDAKPIIDIAVAVASPAGISACRQQLRTLGYLVSSFSTACIKLRHLAPVARRRPRSRFIASNAI